MRGRAFGFVAMLCATWVAARIGFVLMGEQQGWVGRGHVVGAMKRPAMTPKFVYAKQARFGQNAPRHPAARVARLLPRGPSPSPHGLSSPQQIFLEAPPAYTEVQPNSDAAPLASSESAAIVAPGFSGKTKSRLPLQFYAYSFWRSGNAATAVVGNGQYGGSQSAMLMALPLLRFQVENSGSRLALAARASVSHNIPRERELAVGLQWRPRALFPAQVTIERRFRPHRADAFVAFVSGGHDGTALPLGFALDGYGQAGMVMGKAGGGFADFQMHALKPLASQAQAKLVAGAGAWGGGQSKIMRLDIGPSVRVDLPAGPAILRIDASWRFRIAGNAQPGNGPAVTLSTSF